MVGAPLGQMGLEVIRMHPACNPLMKAHRSGDTFLFHGCPQESATNIQADGLKIGYASSGMLGRGLCALCPLRHQRPLDCRLRR